MKGTFVVDPTSHYRYKIAVIKYFYTLIQIFQIKKKYVKSKFSKLKKKKRSPWIDVIFV